MGAETVTVCKSPDLCEFLFPLLALLCKTLILPECHLFSCVQESLQTPWADLPQTNCDASQCRTDRLSSYPPPPPSACIESIPPSHIHMPSRFQVTDDSPSGKSRYTLLSPHSAVHHGHMAPRSSYLPPYNYSEMPLGVEKTSRSKVLPNEVCFPDLSAALTRAFRQCIPPPRQIRSGSGLWIQITSEIYWGLSYDKISTNIQSFLPKDMTQIVAKMPSSHC